jgi:hypothetical protein
VTWAHPYQPKYTTRYRAVLPHQILPRRHLHIVSPLGSLPANAASDCPITSRNETTLYCLNCKQIKLNVCYWAESNPQPRENGQNTLTDKYTLD